MKRKFFLLSCLANRSLSGQQLDHRSKNTDAQGTRASATTLYVFRGLEEGVRLYLS